MRFKNFANIFICITNAYFVAMVCRGRYHSSSGFVSNFEFFRRKKKSIYIIIQSPQMENLGARNVFRNKLRQRSENRIKIKWKFHNKNFRFAFLKIKVIISRRQQCRCTCMHTQRMKNVEKRLRVEGWKRQVENEKFSVTAAVIFSLNENSSRRSFSLKQYTPCCSLTI